MSNSIRYDSLLVHYLTRAFRSRLVGRACHAAPLRQGDRSAALPLDRGEALRFDLDPAAGWIRLVPWPADAAGPAAALNAEIVAVATPHDERWFSLDLRGGSRFRPLERRLVAELHTNHWNLVLLDRDGEIVWVLRPRQAGGRVLRAVSSYRPPPPQPRIGPHSAAADEAWAEWERLLASTPPERLAREAQRRFAYLGPVNVGPTLGLDEPAGWTASEWRAGFERWWRLASLPEPRPVLLRLPAGPHPYPLGLPGLEAEPVADLLEAMARVAAAAPALPRTEPTERWAAAIESRLRQARGRVDSLRQRLERIGDVGQARGFGDLLLARLAAVPRGAAAVRLTGWDGETLEIPLDPALSPAENAARWYDVARRGQRTAARIPPLLRAAEREVERWKRLQDAARAGELPAATIAELQATPLRRAGATPESQRLPYRVFRTSGGLEVRVGRGSADNDRLTFAHSRPGDVWLHARSVPGSHVVLRWRSQDQAPPARDLAEAAGLAAWFSKARSSGLIAVDWTRRRYVRKPRGAAPGAVIPQRVKTVFVEPDPALEERLADDAAAPDPGRPSTERRAGTEPG